jgi:hypothetical protein
MEYLTLLNYIHLITRQYANKLKTITKAKSLFLANRLTLLNKLL